jgi:hypothetical protein
MHLAVAEGALGGHVFCYSADSAGGIDDYLVAFVFFAVLEKPAPMYQNPEMTGHIQPGACHGTW